MLAPGMEIKVQVQHASRRCHILESSIKYGTESNNQCKFRPSAWTCRLIYMDKQPADHLVYVVHGWLLEQMCSGRVKPS